MVELACTFSGYTIVPLYDTLGEEAILTILKQSKNEGFLSVYFFPMEFSHFSVQ